MKSNCIMHFPSLSLLALTVGFPGVLAGNVKRQSDISAFNFTNNDYGNLSDPSLLQYALTVGTIAYIFTTC